jgi:hypothetical protein
LSAGLGHCLEIGNAKNGKNNQYIHQQMQGMDNTKEGKSTFMRKLLFEHINIDSRQIFID